MTWLSRDLVRTVAAGDRGIAMTGASSWLGQAMLALLADEGALTSRTRLRLFGSATRPTIVARRAFAIEALADATPLADGPWLLLHFAFLGKERTADLALDRFVTANDAILADMLRLAAGARELRVAFTSSGAVYGPDRDRNPYGWCKADHERRIAAWCLERDIPLVMPRVFNIGGPSANKVESYALSSMILSTRRRGAIHIAAPRSTYRSYVHVNELLGVLCDATLAQPCGTPSTFDTAGERIVEMAELAAAVAAMAAPSPVQITRAPVDAELSPDRYVGAGATYRALLATSGRSMASLDRIIMDTERFLAASDCVHQKVLPHARGLIRA